MDVDTIAPGIDFVEAIEQAVSKCDVLIAVIGAGWLQSSDNQGRRRLGDPGDIVRLEIGNALKRKIPHSIGFSGGRPLPFAIPLQLCRYSSILGHQLH